MYKKLFSSELEICLIDSFFYLFLFIFETSSLNDTELSKRSLEACVREIDIWMLLNRLKLSKDKTELLAISSVHVLHLPCHIFMSVMRERWLRQKQVTLEFFLTNP